MPSYLLSAGESRAGAAVRKTDAFDRAFVSFSLHHFGNSAGVVGEVLRVLDRGRFVVLDPIIEEAKDAIDIALETKIDQVFRRTHRNDFRFHTSNSIQRLLTKAGYRVPRTNALSYAFNQEGMDRHSTPDNTGSKPHSNSKPNRPSWRKRMKNYFTSHSHGDHAHVKGSFSFALITGVKPA